MHRTVLEIDSISKTYRSNGATVHALVAVSLKAGRGEFIVVHGPSGSGKSTLLCVAAGLLAPQRGSVLIGGQAIYDMMPGPRARFRAAHLGFVFQQFHLIPYLDVLDNVLLPSLALSNGEPPRERALALIDRFNLNDRIAHYPAQVSTGERQRVALARALLNEPELIFADEPTGNLDEVNAAVVLESLLQFAGSGGTVLLATHDTRFTSSAHRTFRLDKGGLS